MPMMGIYEIVNLADGKASSYVGSSVDIKKRWRAHVQMLRKGQHYNPHLQAAFDKYGEGAFSFCVLEQVAEKESLSEREQYFLDRAFEVGDTYNVAQDTTAPMLGCEFSEEHRRKLGVTQSGRRHTEKTRRQISASLKGNIPWNKGKRGVLRLSAETRRRMSAARKGQPKSETHKCKIGAANAKPYPAFVHRETGEIIPDGVNLTALCERRGLIMQGMWMVAHGQNKSYRGWILASSMEE